MASPISAQQASAQESREQFDRRMRNMVSLLKSAGSTFSFYKRVSKSMATKVVQGPYAYSLEFPIKFLDEHSKKFNLDVTFVMKDSERTWPIKLTVRSYIQSNGRVFAYGDGGWKTFLQDNRIKMGDFLIFTLLSFSRFQVVIERAPVEVHPDEDSKVRPKDEGEDNKDETVVNNIGRAPVHVHPQDDDVNDEGNDDNGNNNEGEIDMDIEDEDEDKDAGKSSAKWDADQAPPCPCFRVAILPPSHPGHLSLAVPGRFWDLYGNMLKSNDLQLKGLNKAIFTVKAKRTYDVNKAKLIVCLDSGWEAFLIANKLQVGDILEFFLVGNSCFSVDLLEQIKKH